MQFMEEVWKVIPDYPKYQVSNMGRVKRNNLLVIDYSRNNYGTVTLYSSPNIKQHKTVHNLVLRTFKPNPRPGFYTIIDHINRNTRDNRLSNLRWSNHILNSYNTNARGYSYHKKNKFFQAAIRINGIKKYLGVFKYSTKARKAYLKAKEELLKEIDPDQTY